MDTRNDSIYQNQPARPSTRVPRDVPADIGGWNAAISGARNAGSGVPDRSGQPGVKVAETGDMFTWGTAGCGSAALSDKKNWAESRANNYGQWFLGSGGKPATHVGIEVNELGKDGKPTGERMLYHSMPGKGTDVEPLQDVVDDHGDVCAEMRQYKPNAPLTDDQKDRLSIKADKKAPGKTQHSNYNYVILHNYKNDNDPKQCAQAVRDLQNAAGVPPFLANPNETPLPRDVSKSPDYHRVRPGISPYQYKPVTNGGVAPLLGKWEEKGLEDWDLR